jgi:hypothetical protein
MKITRVETNQRWKIRIKNDNKNQTENRGTQIKRIEAQKKMNTEKKQT